MKKSAKVGIVAAGYILACVAAFAVSYIYDLSTRGTDVQASQGMFAFGQSILFLVVFGVLALIPTVLAFFFLRSSGIFWNGFAVLSLFYSIIGLVVVITNALINRNLLQIADSSSAVISLFGVLGAFGAPIFIVCFLILAVIAPSRRPRLLLLASAGLEILSELYVFVSFLLFQRFF
jgi:hypothetical protein